ncbi:uncharacterized protein G2W53_008360 [Senna tora]|uniref:Uncharacterized protein n=1 Tax=Senna tora TaxID=362788 RepID=A0A834XA14_9FABA|nr:uncharacterized protein G2W53_008360 [Senna tora]
MDRDCNWTVLKTSTELQNQHNNFFTKFGYAYWVDTHHVLFECPKRKTQEWSFHGTTLIQFGIQNLNHDQRDSRGNMFPLVGNQENMEQGFQPIKQELVEQGFMEKCGIRPLVNLDHGEPFNCRIQETDDRKNQEESQIPKDVVVELEFDDSINQVLSQLNLPTRVMDMLSERLRGWLEINSQ